MHRKGEKPQEHHNHGSDERPTATMMQNRKNEFVMNTDGDDLKKSAKLYNSEEYLAYVVNTLLSIATADGGGLGALLTAFADDDFLLDTKKAMMTRFLVEELGLDTFQNREL